MCCLTLFIKPGNTSYYESHRDNSVHGKAKTKPGLTATAPLRFSPPRDNCQEQGKRRTGCAESGLIEIIAEK